MTANLLLHIRAGDHFLCDHHVNICTTWVAPNHNSNFIYIFLTKYRNNVRLLLKKTKLKLTKLKIVLLQQIRFCDAHS